MPYHDDGEPLLEAEKDLLNGSTPVDKDGDKSQDGGDKFKKPRRTVVVEPLLVLYVISGFPLMALVSQYRYLKVARTLGINLTLNEENVTCDTSQNDTHYLDREKVQAVAANWNMYMSLIEFGLCVTLGFVYGSLSDKFGRRPLLILPCIGTMATGLVNMAIVYFDLPLYCFLFTSVEYFFGGMSALFTGCFAYMADTVPKDKLALRITILDAVMLSAGGISSLGTGYVIRKFGYFWPYLFVIGGKGVAMLYAIFFIPESRVPEVQKDKQKDTAFHHIIKGFKLVTNDNGTGRRFNIHIIFLSYMAGEMVTGFSIFSLFEMNAPLCWNSIMMGYFEAVSLAVRAVAMVAAAALLTRIMSEEAQSIISKISSIAEYTFLIFVTNTVMMFFVPVLGAFSFLFLPMYRTILSKMVGLDEQGALFAIMSGLSQVNRLVGSLITNKIYASTLFFMEGFVFLVSAVGIFLSLTIFMVYVVRIRRIRRIQSTAERHIQKVEPVDDKA